MSLKTPTILTLKQKSEVIEQFRSGSSVTSLARRYNVAKSTICAINKKSEKILKCVNDTKFSGPDKRKTLRSSKLPKMENALHCWFLQQRNKNYPVSGLMIKEKAKILHSKIKENRSEFNASDGWLQRFKTRYGVRFSKVIGDKLFSQPDLGNPFKRKLQEKMDELGLSLNQLYNADDSVLFWELLSEKIDASSLGKTQKQRITFLACTNGTGLHRLKLLVIGKIKNPRAFNNFDCPVDYRNSKSSWMTDVIFKDWFHHLFVPQVRNVIFKLILNGKALNI